jgi:DNA invertase Pin-like site-specific DNA recombinase
MEKKIKVILPENKYVNEETNQVIRKKRVCAYARVSTDEEDQLNSYRVQISEYTKMINENPAWELVNIYADEGLSGTNMKKRPQFMKMIESARLGHIDLILTKSISRFGRNTVDMMGVIRELRNIGVIIFFEKENIYSDDPKMDFMLTILASISQEESRSISTNIKWSLERKYKRGEVTPIRIYGYDVKDKQYVINEVEANVIKRIFNLAVSGYNINDICKTLNADNIPTIKGGVWKYGTIRGILENEKYVGDAILQKTVCIDYLSHKAIKNDNIVPKYIVENNHEPIIEREIFNEVQSKLKNKELRSNNKVSKYPLSGILYCPICKRSLKRHTINYGTSYEKTVLDCNHSYHNKLKCSRSYCPDYKLVENAVMYTLEKLVGDGTALKYYSNHFSMTELNKLRKEMIDCDETIKKINNEIAHANDKDDIKTLERKLRIYENKLGPIEQMAVNQYVRYERISHINAVTSGREKLNPKNIATIVFADFENIEIVLTAYADKDAIVNGDHDIYKHGRYHSSELYIDETRKMGINVKVYLNE